MIRSLMTAASGMKAQQLQVDTIANNIANVNTHGFKRSHLSFRSLLYETIREPGAPSSATQLDPTGFQIGSGTEISGSVKVFDQGALQATGGRLDVAVRGEGFLKVQLPNGEERFTRNGALRTDQNGAIVTPEGYLLDGGLSVPNDTIAILIGEDGTVSVKTTEEGAPSSIGNIQLWRFPNPTGLKAQGGSYYTETAASGTPSSGTPGQSGFGTTQQGHLERSNVSTVDELVSLIVAQRNYEVNSRAIRVSDEMLQQVNQLVR